MRHKEKLWTKDFILFCLSYLLMAAGFYFLLPTLPVFVTEVLGEDKSKIGYIIGFYALSALLIRPFSGYALDSLGRRRVYLLSMLMFTLATFLYSYAATFMWLLALRLFHGLGWGMITTGGGTIPADLVPKQRRGEGIGYFGLSITLSMAIGPLLGLWMLQETSFDFLFYATFGITAVSLGLAYLVKYPDIAHKAATVSEEQSTQKSSKKKVKMFETKASHASIVVFLFCVAYASVFSFVAVFSQENKLGHSGLFFFLLAIGVGISRPLAGKMMDRRGPNQIMLLSFLLGFAGFITLSLSSHSLFLFLLAGFIIGIGCGSIIPTLQTMIMNMVLPERRGAANATYYAAVDLGISIGSVVLGYVATWTSTAFMFRICACMFVVAGAYFFSTAYKHYLRNTLAMS